MSRTVAALYQTRAEAEFARSRLLSETGARAPRIIAKDTAAALDGLGFSAADRDSYRAGVSQGGHLLVAQLPRGRSSTRVLQLLKDAIGKSEEAPDVRIPAGSGVEVNVGEERPTQSAPRSSDSGSPEAIERRPSEPEREPDRAVAPAPEPAAAVAPANTAAAAAAPDASGEQAQTPSRIASPPDQAETPNDRRVTEEARIPVAEERLTIEKREVPRGGARMRAFTRETPAEAQVDLRDETLEIESRASDRPLTEGESGTAGLFSERIFEFVQMREEPVVSKEAFVREELIIRKRIDQRTETVRDTVRHTEVEVEELPAGNDSAPALFGRKSGAPRR